MRVCNSRKAVSKICAKKKQTVVININAWIHAVFTLDHFHEFKKEQFYVHILIIKLDFTTL